VRLLAKSGVLDQPCPRCKAEASVDLYGLSPIARRLTLVILVCLVAGMYWDRPREVVYSIAAAVVTLLVLWSDRAICRSCGACLARKVSGGWR
jgi:hypothetical protein